MMICKPIYEFLVWDNCNNNCKFCFQRENPRLFDKDGRKFVLDNVLSFIDSDKFIKGSHILIVGGEIFDKPSDESNLLTFFDEIIKRMFDETIDLLYINTNLIYKNLSPLQGFFEKIKANNLFERLRFTTSYDMEGRFRTEDDRHMMLNNLQWVKENYPLCPIVTNMILTKPMCESILNKEFSPKQFMDTYDCWINFIPYIVYDENLSASRDMIFKTLIEIDKESNGYLDRYIANMGLIQDKNLYMFKEGKFQFCSCKTNKCGHSVNFTKYSTKGSCFICDLKELFNKR